MLVSCKKLPSRVSKVNLSFLGFQIILPKTFKMMLSLSRFGRYLTKLIQIYAASNTAEKSSVSAGCSED